MLAYLGVIVGVILMYSLPWIKKNADLVASGQKPEAFAANYVYAFILNVIIVLLTIGALFLVMPVQESDVGAFAAFWGGLIYAAISASVIKLPFDILQSKGKQAAEVLPPNP